MNLFIFMFFVAPYSVIGITRKVCMGKHCIIMSKDVRMLETTMNSPSDASSLQNQNRLSTEEVFEQFFELLRSVIINGNPESGIPVLDPYKLDYQRVEYLNEYISLKANIGNGVFSGLGGFQILPFIFNPTEISLSLNIQFPLLKFHAEHYDMQGAFSETIPLAGKGKMHLEVHNLIISGKVYMIQAEDSKSVIIQNLTNPNYVIDRLVSQTEYDGNIDGILNAMVEDVVGSYLNRFSKYIAETYGYIVIDFLNIFLQQLDTKKF